MFGSRFQQDFIMRQVELITKFIAEKVFKKQSPEYGIIEEANMTFTDDLHNNLIRMIQEDKINEAENLLFDSLDINDDKYLEVALDFYSRLSKLDDVKLAKSDFSKEEVVQGLADITNKFGVNVSI